MPKWATRARQAYLAELLEKSGGLCVYGEGLECKCPDHLYGPYSENLIREWVSDDASQRIQLALVESERLHRVPDEVGKWGRRFDPVERMVFGQRQPPFYPEGRALGIARVRVPSTIVRLYVQVDNAPQRLSKNARHKWRRYGKAPRATQDQICEAAVKDFWATRP